MNAVRYILKADTGTILGEKGNVLADQTTYIVGDEDEGP